MTWMLVMWFVGGTGHWEAHGFKSADECQAAAAEARMNNPEWRLQTACLPESKK